MTKTLQQTVTFAATPERLYAFYADAKQHSAVTGAPAKFARKVGSPFSAHGGYITGKILLLEPARMIVQTWRAQSWKKGDADSVLMLTFSKEKGGTRVAMVHAGVPEANAKDLAAGWRSHYWNPWKAALKAAAK